MDRVEGSYASLAEDRATSIGPVTWPNLASNFRHLSAGDRGPPAGTGFPFRYYPLKALAFVEAGRSATLSVPSSQRSYVRLLYGDERAPRHGTWDVTLVAYTACRRSHTQFAGGFYIDFDRAPEHGRCSELIVREPRRQPVRKPLFSQC
jgi:hypothetical protein